MPSVASLVLAALFALTWSPLGAQGLGDAAGRERQKREQRREREPKPGKSFTDEDLEAAKAAAKRAADGPVADAPGAAAGPAEAAPDPIERERHERSLLHAEWRVRFANAREQLALAETASWQEVVRTEYYGGIPAQIKVKEQIETAELKRARQALADLQEEFRRTGLPAGWARE